MPTYACSTSAGRLDAGPKDRYRALHHTVHHEELARPASVHVIFYEWQVGNTTRR